MRDIDPRTGEDAGKLPKLARIGFVYFDAKGYVLQCCSTLVVPKDGVGEVVSDECISNRPGGASACIVIARKGNILAHFEFVET